MTESSFKFAVSGRGHGKRGERDAMSKLKQETKDPTTNAADVDSDEDDSDANAKEDSVTSATTNVSADYEQQESSSSKEGEDDEDSSSMPNDVVKNLAKKYLNRKSRPKNSGCCPAEEQTTTKDGSVTSCACPSSHSDSDDPDHQHEHKHEHIHNLPENAPSDMGKQLAAAPSTSCLILGDSGVGKTSFLNMHMTREFSEAYQPTDTVGVAQLLLATNYGFIKVHCIDTAPGGENGDKLGGLDESFVNDVRSVMILFDVTNPKSYKNATKKWLKQAISIRPDIPIVMVGNKCDLFLERKIHKHDVTFHKNKQTMNSRHYCDMSVKIMGNVGDPFLWLLETVTGKENIEFVTSLDEMKHSFLMTKEATEN